MTGTDAWGGPGDNSATAAVRNASPEMLEVRSPSDTRVTVGAVPMATADDVDRAVRDAAAAAPAWATTTIDERLAFFARIADQIDAEADTLADLTARENGSVRAIIRRELHGAAAAWRGLSAYLADRLTPIEHQGADGEMVRIERHPFGVVACIVPWNAPLLLTCNKIAPALAAGNTVVLKPSPLAPLGVTAICRIVADVLPDGVMHVVNGGGDVGAALIGHRLVRKISFTGGTATAGHIVRQSADSLANVHLELGGNDPAIVLNDADIQVTVDRIVGSAYRRAGQVCFAVKRVYVPRTIAATFSESLIRRVNAITVGDAMDPEAEMGPLNNPGQVERVRRLVTSAREAGRDVRELGQVLPSAAVEHGHFMRPVVVLDAEQDDALVQEEQFGPALPVVVYDSIDEAVEWANDTDYGLCSSVWSASTERALEVASRLEAGMTIINNHLFSPTGTAQVPFGGWKRSGIGWEGSPFGLDEYLQFHSYDVQALA